MKKITRIKILFTIYSLLFSGVTFAEQNSNLANLQQGVIIAPCMYALLNGETEPKAYNVVMNQEGNSLTFTVGSVELAKQGECENYSAPIEQAGSLGLDSDSIIPIGCEDINSSIANAIKGAMSDDDDFSDGDESDSDISSDTGIT